MFVVLELFSAQFHPVEILKVVVQIQKVVELVLELLEYQIL